jgi:DedD protein
MSTAQHDTEITLGTGRMLVIFFGFVLVCAFFFAIGFSLGRKTSLVAAGGWTGTSAASPATVVRPSPAKADTAPAASSSEFSFYKAVGEKKADSGVTPADGASSTSSAPAAMTPAAATSVAPAATTASATGASTEMPVNPAASAAPAGGYYVQVAAVSRQEDAAALVEALKKKQYPAFSANNPSADKFYHVQVGPYAEMKDAEAMRARLVGDGYNPIVKR